MAGTKYGSDLRLVVKIARLYHQDGKTQQEIADLLGVSRPKVSRVLSEAFDRGILKITVIEPRGIHSEIESRLEALFGLREAIVVDTVLGAGRVNSVGLAAARCIERIATSRDVLGLTWGATLPYVVQNLGMGHLPALEIVQLIGSLGDPNDESHSGDLASRAAAATGGSAVLLPAPGLVRTTEIREILLSDPQVFGALSAGQRATIALVGIGEPEQLGRELLARNLAAPGELRELLQAGAVGDIALRFFNIDGNAVESDLSERLLGISFADLKAIPKVVGVAVGAQKRRAIVGALRSGIVKTLVTDQETAESILAEVDSFP